MEREYARQGQGFIVENLLKFRFGSLDEELKAIVPQLLKLSPQEFTPYVVRLSREELLSRFGGEN